ncbi:MAG: SIR2 family protein [Ruminococcus flavefaciens]|nr:SIR2 family protein [Ruminococcus flavefaciens]
MKKMDDKEFVQCIYDENNAGQRYCFILGAGASRSAGIYTAVEFIDKWRSECKEIWSQTEIRNRLRNFTKDRNEYDRLFGDAYKADSKDYFMFYDIRFLGQPRVAYNELKAAMSDRLPSLGHFPLSSILSKTRNNLVITTNFDTLIEDALFLSSSKHVLVVGHEKLASHITTYGDDSPIIVKLHHDLYLDPRNRRREMTKLADEWDTPLREVLNHYVPIVIGYNGADQTLMSFLRDVKLRNGIFWCTLEEPADRVKDLIEQQDGCMVQIRGFDEIMFSIGTRFKDKIGDFYPCTFIKKNANKQIRQYNRQYSILKTNWNGNGGLSDNDAIIQYNEQEKINRLIKKVVLSPDEKICVNVGGNGEIYLYHHLDGSSPLCLRGHSGFVRGVVFSQDGKTLISASDDGTVNTWDVKTGQPLKTMVGHEDWVQDVTIASDGIHCISASRDNTLRVWDINTGECVRILSGHTSYVIAVVALPNSCKCISASYDGTLRIWDINNGMCLGVFSGHIGAVTALAVSQDGNRVVSCACDHTVKVWDTNTGTCLHSMEGHTATCYVVKISADGTFCISGSHDKTLRVWDMHTGECLHCLEGHRGWVSMIDISSDGTQCTSASQQDKTLRVWNLETEECTVEKNAYLAEGETTEI